jgi:hypothetical protein
MLLESETLLIVIFAIGLFFYSAQWKIRKDVQFVDIIGRFRHSLKPIALLHRRNKVVVSVSIAS